MGLLYAMITVFMYICWIRKAKINVQVRKKIAYIAILSTRHAGKTFCHASK